MGGLVAEVTRKRSSMEALLEVWWVEILSWREREGGEGWMGREREGGNACQLWVSPLYVCMYVCTCLRVNLSGRQGLVKFVSLDRVCAFTFF